MMPERSNLRLERKSPQPCLEFTSCLRYNMQAILELTRLYSGVSYKGQFASRIMKIVSIIMIIAYLTLPALCFGSPCEMLSADSQHCSVATDAPVDCPSDYDTDYCETTCCCAGHVPLSEFRGIPKAGLIARLTPYEPRLALPGLMYRIFVPPQNHS